MLMPHAAQAQTFSVLHTFTGAADGGVPYAGLTFDSPGILVGTTSIGGGSHACPDGCGVVYQLKKRNSSWILSPLYNFNGIDGATPLAGVTDVNGVLYGTTFKGGSAGKGTVYRLRPQPTPCKTVICYWNETVLHSFNVRPDDGTEPGYGNVTLDRAGNVYGTTSAGGTEDYGTVWKLAPSGGGWTESILYNFLDQNDGFAPFSGVIFDASGNLYGTTWGGGGTLGIGTVYQLVPQSGSWLENILVSFQSGGPGRPFGTLTMDSSGNLYGTAITGEVFKLSPVNGGWTYSVVSEFNCGLQAGVTLGPDGNLYGVCTQFDGWVFRLPPDCNQTCVPTNLHNFDFTDGSLPFGPVVFDDSGNLYGTTANGGFTGTHCGTAGCGTAWEIEGAADIPRH